MPLDAPKRDAVPTVAVLLSDRGSVSTSTQGVGEHRAHPPTTITLSVTPRRGRALLLTVVMLAVLAALTLVFLDGVSLLEFGAGDKTRAAQNKLLDNYNSYSGTVVSAFSKPIEIFTTLAVQIVTLAFVAQALASPTPSWKLGMLTLAASAGVNYLLRNGISALNVQLRPLDDIPRIGAEDLSIQSNATFLPTTSDTPDVSTIAESSVGNPAANTLLRNLVRSPAARPAAQCDPGNGKTADVFGHVPDNFVQLGITQRDWQDRVLPHAVSPTKRARVVINPSNKAVESAKLLPPDLPMNASTAADLFLYGMVEMTRNLPWGSLLGFVDGAAWDKRLPLKLTTGTEVASETGSMADITGMLPPARQAADEQAQRAWFLQQLIPAVTRQFNTSENTSRSDIELEWSHFDLSPTLAFDAMTIEADVDPKHLWNTMQAGGVRYTTVSMPKGCGPYRGACLFPKPPYSKSVTEFDPPAQVRVFSPCADEHGAERLLYTLNRTVRGYVDTLDCPQRSNTSLYVVSIAKRLVADALAENKTANATGVAADPDTALATNLRKIYSFTIGRLSWTLTDLAEMFHAECRVGDSPTQCLGLRFPLASSSNGSAPAQHIVVGANALPTSVLTPYERYLSARPRTVTLARLFEPYPLVDVTDLNDVSDYRAGDILLPHNVGKITWSATPASPTFACSPFVEDRLRDNINNHYYSEHSLQPAYTAATLFLFQDAAIKDTVSLGSSVQTLNFAGTAQDVVVRLSIPSQNAWLTLVGCLVLVLGTAVVIGKPSLQSEPLATITAPQAIARVLLDEKQFPPMVLERHLVGKQPQNMENLVVASIALAPTFESTTRRGEVPHSPAAA